MITNDDARNFYLSQDRPGIFDPTDSNPLQIFRGIFAYGGVNIPGICQRGFMIFQRFQAIQEYCFGCYKVLVEPRTVMELFKLLILFQRLHLPNNNIRKCMTEFRTDCSGSYKGYVSCGGIEEGNEILAIVGNEVSQQISPNISTSLKRGCSEFAAVYPEYARAEPGIEPMKYNEDWREYEEYFEKHARWNPVRTDYPHQKVGEPFKPSEVYAMTMFLHYAATIGDESYLEIAEGILPPIEGIKRPRFNAPHISE